MDKYYYTFIMFKPDALKRELVYQSLNYFKDNGMIIDRVGFRKATEELIKQHYEAVIAKQGGNFLDKLKDYLEGEYVMPIVLKSKIPNIICRVRKLIGATNPAEAEKGTIRGDLGIDSYEKCNLEGRSCQNLIHASDSPKAVQKETAIWFGENLLTNI